MPCSILFFIFNPASHFGRTSAKPSGSYICYRRTNLAQDLHIASLLSLFLTVALHPPLRSFCRSSLPFLPWPSRRPASPQRPRTKQQPYRAFFLPVEHLSQVSSPHPTWPLPLQAMNPPLAVKFSGNSARKARKMRFCVLNLRHLKRH